MMKKKKKKIIIVTGASKGIGRATAQLLSEGDCVVYGVSRTAPQGEYSFTSVLCDVTDPSALAKVYKDIYEKHGAIDCVVNNAGLGIAGAVEDTSDGAVEKIIGLNFSALEKSCRLALPYLREGGGRIINLSSVAAIMPIAFQTYYSATKAAVLIFSRALDQEVRPLGVRVSAVLPGDTKTNFTAARFIENDNPAYSERVARSVGKMEKDEQNGVSPENVAKIIKKALFARNPKTSYIVGFPYKLIGFLNKILPQRLVDRILFGLYAK